MNRRETQCQMVLDYLSGNEFMTQRDADRLGIKRLASRICDLKKEGRNITSELIAVTNTDGSVSRVARYSIRKEEEQSSVHTSMTYEDISKLITKLNSAPAEKKAQAVLYLNFFDYIDIKEKCVRGVWEGDKLCGIETRAKMECPRGEYYIIRRQT